MSTEIQLQQKQEVSVFSTGDAFDHAQRMAKVLSQSGELVPQIYRNNIPNCIIALEMSSRLRQSVLAVMANTSIIHGKASLDSKFIIALINSSGKFKDDLEFDIQGDGMTRSCVAYAEKLNGKTVKSPQINMAMANAEGWLNKSGSKWKTMPDLMLMYRSAAFFGRLYCPDTLMGMQANDEVVDIGIEVTEYDKKKNLEAINSQEVNLDAGNKPAILQAENMEVNQPEYVEYSEVPDVPPAPEGDEWN